MGRRPPYSRWMESNSESEGWPNLQPAPANKTWAIALRKELADSNHLASTYGPCGYIAGGGEFKMAASAEFVKCPAALPAFQSAFGIVFDTEPLLVLAGDITSATTRAAADQTSRVKGAFVYGTGGTMQPSI